MSLIVKICGLTSRPALDAALDAGADWIALAFFAQSPRYIGLEAAAELRQAAGSRAKVIALTVDPDDRLVDDIARRIRPDMIQFHGSETPARVAEIAKRTGLGTIKALGMETAEDLARIGLYDEVADFLILDAKAPAAATRPGGHGRTFEWDLLRQRRPAIPWLLSGGLSARNVGEAIVSTGADGVDVSSGVEIEKGVKDPDLIREFVRAARAASNASAA